jgi:hypothetical protein
LIPLLPNPVGAQVEVGDPAIIGDTNEDDIPNRVVIAFPEGQTCTVDAGATVEVEDPDGTQVDLVDGANVDITETSTDIVIVGTGTDGNIVAEPGEGQEEGTDPGFDVGETGEGTVLSLTGIECTDDDTNPATPTAPACPAGTEVVVRFTSDDTLKPFRIDEEDFQVRYAVDAEEETPTGDESFELSVRQGGDTVESAEESEFPVTDGLLEVDDEGPGTFRLEVDSVDVVFAITVCEGEAGGGGGNGDGNDNGGDGNNNNDDGDVDDPDDVVPGTGDDDPLPDTGGAPLLLGAAALVLAAALLARRILAP